MKKEKKEVRFDARLTEEQKYLFEQAAVYGGYRSLTDFVISAARKEAYGILEKRDMIFASERDRKIFFDKILNPDSPNQELLAAKKEYDSAVEK